MVVYTGKCHLEMDDDWGYHYSMKPSYNTHETFVIMPEFIVFLPFANAEVRTKLEFLKIHHLEVWQHDDPESFWYSRISKNKSYMIIMIYI